MPFLPSVNININGGDSKFKDENNNNIVDEAESLTDGVNTITPSEIVDLENEVDTKINQEEAEDIVEDYLLNLNVDGGEFNT